MMNDLFDEGSLRAEIVSVWGEHGAHVDVYDHMLGVCGQLSSLRAEVERLRAVVHFAEKVFMWEDDPTVVALGGNHELRESAWRCLRDALADLEGGGTDG